MLLGRGLADALVWQELVLARLSGSEGELLGVLCLVDVSRELSATERQLLEALAGHAAMALENVRLFSRVEQSRKQWVEDFDAISDFIVVHDAGNRVLRLNRALAEALVCAHRSHRLRNRASGNSGFAAQGGIAHSAAICASRTRNSSTKPPSGHF